MNENKSFLVIDTLKNCVDCPLTDSYCMLWRDCDYENVIHKDCLFKQLPSKEETDMMKHWCEVGILKEAHEFQINGSGFNSTITRMDNFFNTIYGDNK